MTWSDALLGDLASLHTAQVRPRASPGSIFEHYSIPAFDEGMRPALEPGSVIMSNKVSVPPGSVLMSRLNPRICRVWQPNPSGRGEPVASTEFLVLLPRSDTDRAYLRYSLQAPAFRGALASRVTGTSASHQRVQPAAVLALSVPAPPPRTQQRIGAVLKALDDKIELNWRLNETLEKMARAMFESWVCGSGSGVAQEHLGTVGDVVEFDPPMPIRRGAEHPYLGLAELPTAGPIHARPNPRAFTSGARFRNLDTLLARITPSLENGKACIANSLPGDGLAWGSTELIVMRPRPGVPFSLPYLIARDEGFRNLAIQNMTGTSGRQRVPRKPLQRAPLPTPNAGVLARIGEVVDPMFEVMFQRARESVMLADIRDTLLPKLISGELQIPDAERLVNEVT